MVNKVRSRPNHYEVLGLTPAARNEDVHRAFVGKMSVFGAHSMEETAQFLIAYETLRDAAKRREYDASLGLSAKPEPRQWSIAVTPPRWTPFMVKVPTNEARPKAPGIDPGSEPHVTPTRPRHPASEPQAASSSAPSRPDERPVGERSLAPKQQRQRPVPRNDIDGAFQHIRDAQADAERLKRQESKASDWRKAALVLGGLVVGAGILGTVAGLSVQDKQGAADAEPAAPVKQRLARPDGALAPSTIAPEAAPITAQGDFRAQASAHATRRRAPVSRARHDEHGQIAETLAETNVPTQDAAVDTGAPQSEPQSSPATTTNLPVSTSVIAHTIERIGYACGKVSSAAPVEGDARGVYRITCSSGEAYQASPVHGRYHFRRLSKR